MTQIHKRFATARANGTRPVFLIGDHMQDNDDMIATLAGISSELEEHITIVGIGVCLQPAATRARVVKGALVSLGRDEIPVGVGTDIPEPHPNVSENCPYIYQRDDLPMLKELLDAALEEAQANELLIVCISGMTDLAESLIDHSDRFAAKVSRIALMSGVNVTEVTEGDDQAVTGHKVALDAYGYLTPDSANNNTFDKLASKVVYRRAQELGIPLLVLTRAAAGAAQVPKAFYDDLAATGNQIGIDLGSAQRESLMPLWKKANAPSGSEARGTLPDRCDRAWFVGFFLTEDPGDGDFWPLVKGFAMYDVLLLIAAIDALRTKYFSPTTVNVSGVDHMVIGVGKFETGVTDADALRETVRRTAVSSLS